MKAKASLIFIFVLLLSACGAETGLTPAGSLPPISTENPTAVSSQVPVMAPSLEPAVDSTLEPTISSTLESTSTVQGLSDECEIEDFAFTPATDKVKVGTTVKWAKKTMFGIR